MLAMLLALAAAAVSALGLVLLRKATQAEPERATFSLQLLWELIRHRPVWVAGIGAFVAAYALQVTALANGPLSQVQLVTVLELPFSLVLSGLILGGRLHAREWSAVIAMTLGVAGVLFSLSATEGDPQSVNLLTWLFGLAVTTATITAVLAAGRFSSRPALRTALAGIAAGVTSGLMASLIKPVLGVLGGGLPAVIAAWQTWPLLVVVAADFFLLQNAMQAGRLVASQPGITLANPLVAGAWGIGLFHEQVRAGLWLLGTGLGAALLAAGTLVLSSSALLAGYRESPEDDGLTDGEPTHRKTPKTLHAKVS